MKVDVDVASRGLGLVLLQEAVDQVQSCLPVQGLAGGGLHHHQEDQEAGTTTWPYQGLAGGMPHHHKEHQQAGPTTTLITVTHSDDNLVFDVRKESVRANVENPWGRVEKLWRLPRMPTRSLRACEGSQGTF